MIGALAGSVRVTGLALAPALILEHLRRGRRGRGDARLVLVLLVPLPLLLFGVYTSVHSGDALAYLHAQSSPSFGHAAAWPWTGARATWDVVVSSSEVERLIEFADELAALRVRRVGASERDGGDGSVGVVANGHERHAASRFLAIEM